MKSVLTKISAPLLIGSILALGYMAFPGHAEAGEQRFVFRLKAATVEPVVVADKGDGSGEEGTGGTPGGGSGGDSGAPSGDGGTTPGDGSGTPSGGGDTAKGETGGTVQRHLVMTYGSGHTVTCATDWTADFVEAHKTALTIAPGGNGRQSATISIRKSENGGVGTITARNAWFDLLKSEYDAQALPATYPQVWTWATPYYSADPHPTTGPCVGDVTADGPALEIANGSTLSAKLVSISVE